MRTAYLGWNMEKQRRFLLLKEIGELEEEIEALGKAYYDSRKTNGPSLDLDTMIEKKKSQMKTKTEEFLT